MSKSKAGLPKLEGYVYTYPWDFYGYQRLHGRADSKYFYIEGRDGSMLLGDGLPASEEEAKAYCRCANIAYRQGLDDFRKALDESLRKLTSFENLE